jgi:hypothetical protein
MSINVLSPHSADVQMWLDCGEHGRAKLKRVTPTSVVLWQSFDAPPCEADLIVFIDGVKHVVRVHLERGLARNRLVATIRPIDDVAPF